MKNGGIWPDNNGCHINAHAGSFLFHRNRWYWYGEHKIAGWDGRLAYVGVHVYSSSDFISWNDEGIALKVSDDPASPICRGCRIERPKVIYCASTGKFVMYFHSTDDKHTIAKCGVAVSGNPTGPFEFLYAKRPDRECWPLDVTNADKDEESIRKTKERNYIINRENEEAFSLNLLGRDFSGGQMSRDQTLFTDDDGKAYHIYASEQNSTLHISLLTDDYLHHSGIFNRAFHRRWMEAPVIFKRDGLYYLFMSGCTGWYPNAARGAWAENIMGPWHEFGNPCTGYCSGNNSGPETTFNCQGACAVTLGEETFIMLDRWNMENFIDSRYCLLKVKFLKNGEFELPWNDFAFAD